MELPNRLKLEHADVGYRITGRAQRCAVCANAFTKTTATGRKLHCKLVADCIADNGWCRKFAKIEAETKPSGRLIASLLLSRPNVSV